MSEMPMINEDLVRAMLKQLRPVDISLGIRVYRGSVLQPCPSSAELATVEARPFWLAAMTSYVQSQSHSGLYLDPAHMLSDFFDSPEGHFPRSTVNMVNLLGDGETLCRDYPELFTSVDQLDARSAAVFVYRPTCRLVYLQRWYRMEAKLGSHIRERLGAPNFKVPEGLELSFKKFFPLESLKDNPWQAAACCAALRHKFAVITGGPGTGKTTTVSKLVALLLSFPETARPKSIHMVAPTGKAAERLRESFAEGFQATLGELPAAERSDLAVVRDRVLSPASTIHSFLGSRGDKGFSYHAGNPVNCDVLIVDESSMVDLELFVALFDALKAECRVILLGDKNQLAAVGTGNVFMDLTGTKESTHGDLNWKSEAFRHDFKMLSGADLPETGDSTALCGDAVIELSKSYRFAGDSAVGQLARLLLTSERLPNVDELELALHTLEDTWRPTLYAAVGAYREKLQEGAALSELLDTMADVRILCAVRSGEHGVEAINEILAEYVLGAGRTFSQPQDGLPFIVRANDKNLGLANGDCGIFRANAEGEVLAYLPSEKSGGPLRTFNPFALPSWEAAFALTIHKSQGSEYDAVVVVLPEIRRNFISWELVYTAITRGKKQVSLILPKSLLGQKLPRISRRSGLRQELL